MEVVLDNEIQCRHLWVHDDDRQRDACFAKFDTLVCHCYREIIDELDDLIEEYTDKYGPLTASDSMGDTWNWVEGPWPWQRDTDRNTKGDM